jgi:hypothetical protein
MIEARKLDGNVLPDSGRAKGGYRIGEVVVIHGVAVGQGTREKVW